MNSKYRVTLAWGVKDSHILSGRSNKATLTRKMPYTTNDYYILAYAYYAMISDPWYLKELSQIPNLDDVYLIEWEIID